MIAMADRNALSTAQYFKTMRDDGYAFKIATKPGTPTPQEQWELDGSPRIGEFEAADEYEVTIVDVEEGGD